MLRVLGKCLDVRSGGIGNGMLIQSEESRAGINVKTAKTLGVNFPLSLLGRADEAVE
jgi:hypothetical protein